MYIDYYDTSFFYKNIPTTKIKKVITVCMLFLIPHNMLCCTTYLATYIHAYVYMHAYVHNSFVVCSTYLTYNLRIQLQFLKLTSVSAVYVILYVVFKLYY